MVDRVERLNYFRQLQKELLSYDSNAVKEGFMSYCLKQYNMPVCDASAEIIAIKDTFTQFGFTSDLENIVEFFEFMLDKDTVDENGIVFTPKYIAEYIIQQILENVNRWADDFTIVDPGCGCGIFLIAAAEYIHNKFKIPMQEVIERHIFGMDINENNVQGCRFVLSLLNMQYGGSKDVKTNIYCCDSLKESWHKIMDIKSVNFVIGNPPYINPHDLNKETVAYLKKSFRTTSSGVFNIFYAFIEKAMANISEQGRLGFILPNNFLTIKSAKELRGFIQENNYISRVVDFGDNMVFRPVRTYNCLAFLDRIPKDEFDYCVLRNCVDIHSGLKHAQFMSMPISALDINGWKLADEKTRNNLKKIESQGVTIKSYIRTGIATLRDGVYLVDCDENGYYKMLNGKRYEIDPKIVTEIFKIPELAHYEKIEDAKRHIIFPYEKKNGKFVILPEHELKEKYPSTYSYLEANRKELACRDKGKPNSAGWYAYGRTQGLNKYGKKLLFPTFSNKPKFTLVTDEFVLFCNGYAVFEDPSIPLTVLQKILNSSIMEYYVRHTSYPIEGGYYCYQKKYIEKFSIPVFSSEECEWIDNNSQLKVDEFLVKKYQIDI